jgi:MinD-like ATPase involved in chromosome partitioning or flagellar assembly
MEKGGLVATFYSFKGGVGRSFALASVASALAKWGFRVLAVDWDLDAPGLSSYFKLGPQKGLFELILQSREHQTSSSDSPNTASPPEREWRSAVAKPRLIALDGQLDVITAGRQDTDYVNALQEIRWKDLYEYEGFAKTLERWRAEWKEDYDFVLIDSRTGVTDIGALCTVHLPDILFVFFTANR